jgi:hypothetical protein
MFIPWIVPLLFVVAPTSFHMHRTAHFLLVSLVCVANMSVLYVQPYMLSGSSEPDLSLNTCRLVVYLSTFAKPMGLYLTTLFSIERVFVKILAKFLLKTAHHRQLFKRCYSVSMAIGILIILSIRFYEIMRYIPRNSLNMKSTVNIRGVMLDTDSNATARILSFRFCYQSMKVEIYAKILSFYVMQYWSDYFCFALILLVCITVVAHQLDFGRSQRRSPSNWSVNTKLYLSLSSCVLVFEMTLRMIHEVVDNVDYNNSVTQVNYLQTMLFVFNLRAMLLPLILCVTLCEPLKRFFNELLFTRAFLENVDEIDRTSSDTASTWQRRHGTADCLHT